jgi:hypothetical protein
MIIKSKRLGITQHPEGHVKGEILEVEFGERVSRSHLM